MKRWLLLALLPLAAQAVEPQPFDYWMLALSWSPQYCTKPTSQGDPQCGANRYGFVVHGLWPQYAQHQPQRCAKPGHLPKPIVQRMLPLMPSERLIRHEWNRHGTCTGREPGEYFAAVESAWRSVKVPLNYTGLEAELKTSAAEVERQFQTFNPGHDGRSIQLQCNGQYLREVRLCMDQRFQPHACAAPADACKSDVILRPSK